MNSPTVSAFFDEATNTVSYVVQDASTGTAAIIDPVLDFDAASGRTARTSADRLLSFVAENKLDVEWILETHVHADHLTGAKYLKETLGAPIAIGANVGAVQKAFKSVFNFVNLGTDGSQFDHLFVDGDSFSVGSIAANVIATPGHTPACVTYRIGDAAFVGDTLFMPDYGSARCDFPGGDAAQLYDSIQRIFELPDDTRLFMCHDYKAPGRDDYSWETTVREQRENNVHVNSRVSKSEYVAMREKRDSKLGMPKLLIPSIQVNIRAGDLPEPDENGIAYLKWPVDTL